MIYTASGSLPYLLSPLVPRRKPTSIAIQRFTIGIIYTSINHALLFLSCRRLIIGMIVVRDKSINAKEVSVPDLSINIVTIESGIEATAVIKHCIQYDFLPILPSLLVIIQIMF
jgi:hypothetical protein